ncbi:hypothetical protein JRI60_26895 [Archangium violaceum]|uniref:hypothetical protein n=1 Tax=Archangium violaceum TaxID=83451 RepID=UPI0019503A90|nr:hypothetical protein [Archangium violaceum]QRN92840.1 hypothetical protein JRI60_26895 [Archangium violaceum]
MKSISTLTLTGPNTSDMLARGKLDLDENRLMQGIRCKVTFPIQNTSGGAITLSDTQKQSLLDGFRVKLSYGKSNRRIPYNLLSLTRMQRIARLLLGSEWEGYTNSSTGLARSLTNGTTTQCVLWVVIPTGYLWNDRDFVRFFGVGRYQAKTMQLEWKRGTDSLPSGCAFNGNITVEVFPDDFSCAKYHNRFTYLPEWQEVDEIDKVARLPRGLPLYLSEDSAVQLSTVLSNIEVRIGEDVLYTDMSAIDGMIQKLDVPNAPGESYLNDRETPLYWPLTPDVRIKDLPAGEPRLRQITKTLGTAKFRGLIMPIPGEDEVREDIQDVAGKTIANKTLRAVNLARVLGLQDYPDHLHAYAPMVFFDQTEPEFEQYAGLVSDAGRLFETGEAASVFIPASLLERARGAYAQYRANGEAQSAEGVAQQLALQLPGAVQDVRGFASRGSRTLDDVRKTIS